MKIKFLIIALIAVFAVSFAVGDAEARKAKFKGNIPFVSSEVVSNQISAVQKKLAQLGYDPGPADGVLGPQTTEAIKQFQRDNGLEDDGIVGLATREALGI